MDITIITIEKGSVEETCEILKRYNEKNQSTFHFNELNEGGKRKRLWKALFLRLNDNNSKLCYLDCLSTIRILSRDKSDLNDLLEQDWIDCLLDKAGIKEDDITDNKNNLDYNVILEAEKCLSNIIFNSPCAQAWCAANDSIFLPSVLKRLKIHKDLPYDICLFDLKLLFLITALCEETRDRVSVDLKGFTCLTEYLERLVSNSKLSDDNISMNLNDTCLASEVLKILFNITKSFTEKTIDEEEEAQFRKIVPIICTLLKYNNPQGEDFQRNCIHILMATPPPCYNEMIPVLPDNEPDTKNPNRDLQVIDIILDNLEKKLNILSGDLTKCQEAVEQICPLLSILKIGSFEERAIRKHAKARILPPLKEVHKRPEEDNSLRGSLCKLLTCVIQPLRELSADLLFILCKEQVSRMVKYTGYGNCAGLLADRGLMLGGRSNKGHYSSESEDSDTEEYKEHRSQINPVTGCVEPPHPDPMANMSDEQKEYEAIQVVNLIDKLQRSGVVLPGKIGEDGKPQPLKHVLQLQESLQCIPPNVTVEDGDSD